MKVASLFAGVGGFDLGLERAGMRTVAQVEIDPYCRQVLEAHWPKVPRFDDVRRVTADDLPAADVITGGFPCQDVSVAGRRRGLDGERSGLWFEFARLILEVAPTWVLIENVPGLLSSNGGRDMGTIVGFLGQHGFRWAYRVLDAQWFGVAQRRRRVFIVASRGAGSPTRVLFEPESSSRDTPTRSEAGTVAAAITRNGSTPTDVIRLGGIVVSSSRRRALPATKQTTYLALQPDDQGTHPGALRAVEIDTAPTLSATEARKTDRGARVVTPSAVRRLMPVECERLQGFPDGWSSSVVSDTQAYRQMGNAVCVPVAEWVGRRMMEAL